MTWGTPVQSFVFLGLLVFELEPMYATLNRQTDGRRRSPLNAPRTGRGHNNWETVVDRRVHAARRFATCKHGNVCLSMQNLARLAKQHFCRGPIRRKLQASDTHAA